MTVLAVSGTGTEVGKTVVTAGVCALALRRGSSVAVVKAAQTGVGDGEPGDLAEVARLCDAGSTESTAGARLTLVEGARYPDPLSPAAAARLSGRPPVDLRLLASRVAELHETHRLIVIEGAGGLLVRFDEDGSTLADLAGACAAEVLIVAAAGLGTLNTTALTLEALAHRGLPLGGVVIGSWPAAPDLACRSNVSDLEMLAARPLLGALPAGAGALSADDFYAAAEAGLGPALGGRFQAAAFRAAHRAGSTE